MQEKRENLRRESVNFFSYVLVNPKGDGFGQGLGRTLNLSKGGTLLEVNQEFSKGDLVELTFCHEERLMFLTGRVIYSRPRGPHKFESGIQFLEAGEQDYQFLTQFIKTFTIHTERRQAREGLRSKISKLEKISDFMAAEHRVVIDYVLGFKNLTASEPQDLLPHVLKTLLSFMKRDLKRHFALEEQVFFPAALMLDSSRIKPILEQLEAEHRTILEKLTAVLEQAEAEENGWCRNSGLLERLQGAFDLLKGHSQKEIFELYREMDRCPEAKEKIEQLLKS